MSDLRTKPAKPSNQPDVAAPLVSRDAGTCLPDAAQGDTLSVPGLRDMTLQNLRAVSDFAVMEKLGQGGMGVVYAAREKSLSRNVAVKRLNALLSTDEKHRQGFKAEAKITGSLAHPNIIPIYSIIDEKEDLAITMKLIKGHTLREILSPESKEQRALSLQYDLKAKIQILITVCNAVRFAHSKDIIHRDIKSSNIMVGEFGEILLLDWGLAVSIAGSLEDAAREGLPHKSTIRGLEGTLFYMPPEMLKTDLKKIGIQTDVYLLGGVLFEILTGAAPHVGRKISDVLDDMPKLPPELPTDVDLELRSICRKALHPNAEDRYASALEFQTALTDFLQHGESRAACAAGRALFLRASDKAHGELKGENRTEAYDLFAGAVFSFANAEELWRDNEEAVSGGRKARLKYAECATEHGDFGLALLQLGPLQSEEVDILRREVAKKERAAKRAASAGKVAKRIVASAAFLTVVSAVLFFVVLMGASAIGRQAAHHTGTRLEQEGLEQMKRVALNATAQISTKKQLSETALMHFMHIAETDNLLNKQQAGTIAVPPVSDLNRQLEILSFKAKPLALQFVLVSSEAKMLYSYPENGSHSGDFYGPQFWFDQAKKANGMIHTLPKADPKSGRIFSATAAPIFKPDGTFIGAAAMITDLRDMLGGMTFPSNWGNDVKTEIVTTESGKDENGIYVYFSRDFAQHVEGGDNVPGAATVLFANRNVIAKMRRDADAGRAGVVEWNRAGTDVFAGYTSLPGTLAQVMVTVPKRDVTAMADEIEATILSESQSRLLMLGKIVVGVFVMLLSAALVLVRRVR
jgi:hypothetical protein